MSIQHKARSFAVWRFANPRDWDVSYEDIAKATGLTRRQVEYAIQSNGWSGRIGQGRIEDRGAGLRAWHFKRGDAADINMVDLTLIMSGDSLRHYCDAEGQE